MSDPAPSFPTLDVLAIDPAAVDALWPTLGPYLERALAYGYDAYTLAECRRRLTATPPELIAVVCMAKGTDEPLVVLTLELAEVQGIGRVCHFVTAAGEEMDTWATWLDPILVEVAREQGADYLTTKGRAGWARALKPLGYEHLYTICGKKVTP